MLSAPPPCPSWRSTSRRYGAPRLELHFSPPGCYSSTSAPASLTTGRLIWAFARDHGLPFSNTFSKVHTGLEVPVNATIFTGVFCMLYGLIYIGSTTAFNSFIATSILFLNATYALPQGVALFRGRKNALPTRHFDLGGVFGAFCNGFSVLWVALFTIIFCFPVFRPVTVETLNYVSVIIAGVCVFVGLLWWCDKRKTFTGPGVVGLEALEALEIVRTADGSVHFDHESKSDRKGKTETESGSS